jgi:hypothetical protein
MRTSAVVFCAALGFLSPAAYGIAHGIPEPVVHDEFAYLLGARTFAEGRLTNDSPPLPEFFESPHVLVVPTYNSKYPPGQSLILALGHVLGGAPIWGVWVSCGFFAGCLCWMLQAWTTRQWALVITVLEILTLGTTTYWAQSYWGGMLAASGGALLFGGLVRTLTTVRPGPSLLLAIGVVILANTRPYEGLITTLPAATLLATWLFRSSRVQVGSKLRSFVLPVTAVFGFGVVWMGLYNRTLTGSWTTIPYRVHDVQYWNRGPFVLSSLQEPTRPSGGRSTRYFRDQDDAPPSPLRSIPIVAQNFVVRLPGSVAAGLGIFPEPHARGYQGTILWLVFLVTVAWPFIPKSAVVLFTLLAAVGERVLRSRIPVFFFHSVAVATTAWIAAFGITHRRHRWAQFIVITIVLVVLGESFVRPWLPHYAAPIVPLVLAAMAITAHRISRHSTVSVAVPHSRMILVLSLCHLLAIGVMPALFPRANDPPIPIARRTAVIRQLERHDRSSLVFVRYPDDYTVHDEWVYNPDGLVSAQVIFAHDLGSRNAELIARYPDRAVWLVEVSDQVRLEPYGVRR